MLYDTLGFALTRKCNARCDICCFECSPERDEVLNTYDVERFLASAVGSRDLTAISFTGGEPFLLFDDLLRLTEYAASILNVEVSCVTNCGWAKTESIATDRLGLLVNAGLSRLSVSHDSHHGEFVPATFVMNVLNACHELNLIVSVSVITTACERPGKFVDDLETSAFGSVFLFGPCLPVGAAEKNFSEKDFARASGEDRFLCNYSGNISVGYDGMIYPCCSQTVLETNLSIGSFKDISYKDAVSKLENNGLLFVLRTKGLRPFFDYATNVLGMHLPREYVNGCELCKLLFSDTHIIDEFAPLIRDEIAQAKRQNQLDVGTNSPKAR